MQENGAWAWWVVPRLKWYRSLGLTLNRAVHCRTGLCPRLLPSTLVYRHGGLFRELYPKSAPVCARSKSYGWRCSHRRASLAAATPKLPVQGGMHQCTCKRKADTLSCFHYTRWVPGQYLGWHFFPWETCPWHHLFASNLLKISVLSSLGSLHSRFMVSFPFYK